MNRKIITISVSVIIIIAVVVAISMVMFNKENSSDNNENNSTITSAELIQATDNNTSVTTNNDTVTKRNTSKSENSQSIAGNESSADESADTKGLTTEQVADILADFYGSTYIVTAGEKTGLFQEFSIVDKKGGNYATMTVNLSTGDATEKILQTEESNNYNLLV